MPITHESSPTHSAKTASWNSASIDTSAATFGSIILDVTEDVAGALDAEIEQSPDDTNWYPFATPLTFTQFTSTSVQVKDLPDGKPQKYIRVKYTLTSGTWTVKQHTVTRA